MLTSWRIVKSKHAATAFDGEGARRYGGRWTNPGRRVIYTAGSIAAATLEVLAHLDHFELLGSYALFEVSFPESVVEQLAAARLPRSWREFPAPATLQALGDAWLAGRRSAVLRVPSAITGIEHNYLLNPEHPDYRLVGIGPQRPYAFDHRLR